VFPDLKKIKLKSNISLKTISLTISYRILFSLPFPFSVIFVLSLMDFKGVRIAGRREKGGGKGKESIKAYEPCS
jgi:hypothetical protein